MCLAAGSGCAQPAARDGPPTTDRAGPRSYECRRAARPINIDGRLADAEWASADWTSEFVDIEGDSRARPRFATRAKLLWDDEHLYIAATLAEPHVWATLTRRDAVIFEDNDFEVFIDPDGNGHTYFELEINALNTCWDLYLPRSYRNQGTPDNEWNIDGLRTAVFVDGTLNDPRDTDRAWSVEMAMPWRSLSRDAGTRIPPGNGDVWRVNFSRVQWRHRVNAGRYQKLPAAEAREDNWVWSPQGVIDMHRPEKWGYVRFVGPRDGKSR